MDMSQTTRRKTYRILGIVLWISAVGLILGSAWGVRARALRPQQTILLEAPEHHRLRPGDVVYETTPAGMRRIGEVSACGPTPTHVELTIRPAAFARMTTASTAACWRTPLSAEESIETLLPHDIQVDIASCIATDWKAREAEFLTVWRPLIAELAQAYISVVAEEIERVLFEQQGDIAETSAHVTRILSTHWPAIQRRLSPILREHLTPVLSRLMHNALDDAPKTRIAWHLYRNNGAEALRLMLDWLTTYLAELTTHDREALTAALRKTWASAAHDEELAIALKELSRSLSEDEDLRVLLRDVYHEVIADNPRTAEFIRTKVVESPTVRAELYRLLEWFGPTARQVAKIVLFNDGYTRPEVVHLLRLSCTAPKDLMGHDRYTGTSRRTPRPQNLPYCTTTRTPACPLKPHPQPLPCAM